MRHVLWGLCALLPSLCLAEANKSSFTPSSFKVPVLRVTVEGQGGAQAEVYVCPDSTGAACWVDFADNTALGNLFANSQPIDPGTYDTVRISTCPSGAQGFNVQVMGSVALGASPVTYYTATDTAPLGTSAGSLGYVNAFVTGCGMSIPLSPEVVVTDGDAVALSAFFSLRNSAWGQLDGSYGMGGCAEDAGHTQAVCVVLPSLVSYAGTASPSLETYYVTEDVTDTAGIKANGQVLLLADPTNKVFAGVTRRLYSESSTAPSVNYDCDVKSIEENNDGTLNIATWGGNSNVNIPYVRFPTFTRADHTSNLLKPDDTPVPYRAVKQ
jgi:hypothetical protein